jgi:glycolate oxidase iron-sulfur subunit
MHGVRDGVPVRRQIRAAYRADTSAIEKPPRPASERWFRRLLFSVLPYPARLRSGAPLAVVGPIRRSPAILKLLPETLRNMLTLAPSVALANTRLETPELTAAAGPVRTRVGLVTGCVQRAFFGDVNQATARVLASEGCEVHAPRSQGCCGALALHAGEDETARAFRRRPVIRHSKSPASRQSPSTRLDVVRP